MDRLPPLIAGLAALALGACEERRAGGGEPSSRVNAVKADPGARPATEGFCDVRFAAAEAPAFRLPALNGAAAAGPRAGSWRWVNLWATWCKPCLEEIPRLRRWTEHLSATVQPIELAFVSVDESEVDLARFLGAHPEIGEETRLADPAALPTWLGTLGLDGGAPIPIHVWIDPAGRTRCVRAGAVGEEHYEAVVRLLGE
jgi:thiol-disulfide isomerase/thioredoxin